MESRDEKKGTDEKKDEPITVMDRIIGFVIGAACLALAAAIWLNPGFLDTILSADVSGRGGHKVKFYLSLIWNRPVGTIGGLFGLVMLMGAFGKKKEAEEKAADEDDLTDILPVLKPAEWGASSAPGGTIVRPFWEKTLDDEKFLVIGYGIDKGAMVTFIREQDLPKGTDREELHVQALNNLEKELKKACRWEKMETGNNMDVAVYSGHYNCAEAVLSPSIMNEAHRMLGTDQLMVGIATRGVLMATDAKGEKENCFSFAAATIKRYYTGEEAPITPKSWIVVNGKVEGYAAGMEEVEEKIAAESKEEANEENKKVQLNAITATDKDGDTVHLTVFTEEKDLLVKTVRDASRQTAQKISGNKSMSGRIKAVIFLPASLKEAEDEIRQELERLTDFMNQQFEQMQLGPKPGVICSLSYEFQDSPF